MLVLRGVVALLFGVLAMAWPGLTLLWLVVIFSVYALFAGVSAVIAAWRQRQTEARWWLVLILGLCSIGAGLLAMFMPGVTALFLILLMGVNAIVTGAFDIAVALRLRKQIRGEWLLVLVGLISIAFGLLVVVHPAAGALALVWLISLYAVVTGAMLLMLGLKARRWARRATSGGLPAHS
jgi:uncharacterized membrane protein HdeD (DUF308 family)